MAIIIMGKSECSLCGRVLVDGDKVVGSPHFIHDQAHPLWRFSDSAIHQACFLKWPDADEFRAAYNKLWNEQVPQHRREMLADGTIITV